MESLVITLYSSHPRGALDLELSADVPVRRLIPPLVQELKLSPPQPEGQPLRYQLTLLRGGHRALGEHETLSGAGVLTGDFLSLSPSGKPMPPQSTASSAGAGALLRFSNGKAIVLNNFSSPQIRVGRFDANTGVTPEVDLSYTAQGSTVSRSHAQLTRQGQQWVITALSSHSPTYVAGQELLPQQSRTLNHGDLLKLGSVELRFERIFSY